MSGKVWYCANCGYEVSSRGRCFNCGAKLQASPLPELASGPDDDEVGYRLDQWDDPTRGRLILALINSGVRHRFEEEELVILAVDEAEVDRLVGRVTGTADDDDEDEDGDGAPVTTGDNVALDLYEAAKVLRTDPTDMQADVALGESSAAVFAVDFLPDLDEEQLAAVGPRDPSVAGGARGRRGLRGRDPPPGGGAVPALGPGGGRDGADRRGCSRPAGC